MINEGEILPILRRQDWIQNKVGSSAAASRPELEPVEHPFRPVLAVLLTVPQDGLLKYLSHADIADLDIDVDDALSRAVANLDALRDGFRTSFSETNEPFAVNLKDLNGSEMLDVRGSGIMLSEAFWIEQAERANGPMLASVYNRDFVQFLFWNEREGLNELKKHFEEAYRLDDFPLSPELFQWTGNGWLVV